MIEKNIRILVVDDEAVVRNSLCTWFEEDGYEVETAESGHAAIQLLEKSSFDIGLLDIKMPGMDGLELQRKISKINSDMTVVIMTAYASVQTAVEALKEGAYDYILKPFDPEQLAVLVRNAVERKALVNASRQLERRVDEEEAESRIIGTSDTMHHILSLVDKVAATDSTVLILGESGTGKELIARNIHARSKRRLMPLITVNCGALPEGILESELFGHEKGAFTGAQYRRKGRFELADGGTIFLDEIGDIGPKTQSDLLRVLEEKKITRVGGSAEIEVDFRVVAATNRDIGSSVEQETFRRDLYYRLNVFTIHIPPLRERVEDIMPLAYHFLEEFNAAMGKRIDDFSKEAEKRLLTHSWPGNVRELENAVERAMVVCSGGHIDAGCFPFHTGQIIAARSDKSLDDVQAGHIHHVLLRHGWNISESARVLGIDRVTLYNKIKKSGLKRPDGE